MRTLRRYIAYRRHGFGHRAALSWARLVECRNCDGTGDEEVPFRRLDGPTEWGHITCEECGGLGWIGPGGRVV